MQSLATGVAIARILDDTGHTADPEVIAEYVEQARVRLHLDNASLTCAMMIAQPLVTMWAPEWKFAYTIALCLGTKL